ncbi:hypothetical protein GCM10009733_072350 [Nonomuraea maheshkhaliensis]|uniref:Uncharacterized protein n=1 Tax=Nonomuraea maheshkhaliensis TaxID=419590 RepID=A0ABP4S0M1_9ACTN
MIQRVRLLIFGLPQESILTDELTLGIAGMSAVYQAAELDRVLDTVDRALGARTHSTAICTQPAA